MSADGRAQVRWARACVRDAVGGPAAVAPAAPWCEKLAATFVTLRWRDGALQGCIGALRACRTLVDDIAYNAVAAATRDRRGRRLAAADVDNLHVELSILSPLELIGPFEPAVREAIRVGVDGLVLEAGEHRATLLPSMWSRLRDVDAFLEALADKAGLPREAWSAEARLLRYTTERHVDPAPETS